MALVGDCGNSNSAVCLKNANCTRTAFEIVTPRSRRVEDLRSWPRSTSSNSQQPSVTTPPNLLQYAHCSQTQMVLTTTLLYQLTHSLTITIFTFGCYPVANIFCSCRGCCLGAAGAVGPDACFCKTQQSSSASCILNGVCSGAASRKTSSLICIGTSTVVPGPVCTIPGALACSGTGSTEVDSSCGIVFGNQYYLSPTTSQCVLSCAPGSVNTAVNGVGTCTSSSALGNGVTTCSSNGTPLSCGVVGTTQYYLDDSSLSLLISLAFQFLSHLLT